MWFAPTECANNDTYGGRQPLLSWRYDMVDMGFFLWNYCVGNVMAHLVFFPSIVVATVMERIDKNSSFESLGETFC